MKIKNLLIGLSFAAGLVVSLHFLHAQETEASDPTNTFWLSVSNINVSGRQINFVLQNTLPGSNYTLLTKQNLTDTSWGVAGTVTGALNQTWTAISIPLGAQSSAFFEAVMTAGQPASTNLWLVLSTNALATPGFLTLELSNTIQGQMYLVQTNSNLSNPLAWAVMESVTGAVGNVTLVQVQMGGPALYVRAASSETDNGNELPAWWELEYYGHTGVDANAQDGASDGWTIYQKYMMGLNPNVFSTPPAPQGVTVAYDPAANTATVGWDPSPGPVTGYTITDIYGYSTNVGATATSVSLSASLTPYDLAGDGPNAFEGYSVQADYAGGVSASSDEAWFGLDASIPPLALVPAAQGLANLAISPAALSSGTAAIRLTRVDQYAAYYEGVTILTNFDIPLSTFTNGLYLIPSAWLTHPVDVYGQAYYNWWGETINANGGPTSKAILLSSGFNLNSTNGWMVPPDFDGRVQMKQNLVFQLRSAQVDTPFQFKDIYPTYTTSVSFPTNYAYAGFYDNYSSGAFNALLPFVNNYTYRNFVFNQSDLSPSGLLNSVTNYLNTFTFGLTEPSPYFFRLPVTTTNLTPIPSLLDTNSTRWLGNGLTCYLIYYSDTGEISSDNYWEIAMELNYRTKVMTMGSNITNLYGLPFVSTVIANGNAASQIYTIYPGENSTNVFPDYGWMYSEVAQPVFQTAEYDFWNATNSALPGSTSFSKTNQSALFLITGVGSQIQVAGYAKLAVTNCYSGVYGYLGQYFDQAYQIDTNGVVTTNTTGVLSPYGDFFATQPGPVALVTMPDPDTGQRGTCTVYCVSLALDKNHNGVMNTSFGGPDATPQSSPMIFWANNNYDRWATNSALFGLLFTDVEQDDQQVGFCPAYPNTPTPDCNYSNVLGNGYAYRAIPCTRDLEDFARLWVCGVTSNLLAALPAGSTVTLNWGDVGNPNSGNPTIDLFQAADPDGGIGYLTNETIAAEQTNYLQYRYVGRLGPGGSIQLNSSYWSGWAGNHFIWCGVSNGMGQLNLTIMDANSNVLAQTSQWVQLVDIKQMYERWTVGDNPANTPYSVPEPATEGLAASVPTFRYPPPTDTNMPYILHLHGFNVATWEKDREAETEYKRLYWQGYQGRFGSFRWPTTLQNLNLRAFDNSESNAWASATGLLNLLTNLNAEYPGHVYLTGHSHGNVVAGEALRLAGSNQVVNTYVAMQGAIDSHTYDPTTPARAAGFSTPDRYGQYYTNGAPSYFNGSAGAGTYVNFFNTNDWALAANIWQADQNSKPDYGYGYDQTNFFYQPSLTRTYLYFPGDTFKIFSYCDQAHGYALGAQPNVGGAFTIARQIELDVAPYNFGKPHIYHSGEFRSDYAQRWQFWNQVLVQMKLKLQ